MAGAAPPPAPYGLTVPRDQVLFGHIASLKASGARYVMRLDPAVMVTGKTASALALQLYGSPDVPNDYLIFDPDHKLLTFVVPRTARATVVTNGGRGVTSSHVTVAQLARIVAGRKVSGVAAFEPRNPFWIAIRLDRAVELDQQYTP